MNEMIFYDTLRQGLWITVMISTPILVTALLAGVPIPGSSCTQSETLRRYTWLRK
jgi:flagellar biosynthesis protein FliQ